MIEHDVIVAGGGTAGWIAALAAAKMNKKVLLLERKGYLGGVLPAGLPIHGFYDGAQRRVVKGLAHEFVERLTAVGASTGYHFTDLWFNAFVVMNCAAVKPVIFEMLAEAGVEIQLYSQAVGVVKEGDRLRGIVVQTKNGQETISGKVFIDATGDATVASLAGAAMQEITGHSQPPSLVVRIENVDVHCLRTFLAAHPNQYLSFRMRPGKSVTQDFLRDTQFFFVFADMVKQFPYTGSYSPFIDRVMFTVMPGTRGVIVNMLRAHRVDCNSSESLSQATGLLYRNALHLVEGFRELVPGFADAYLCDCEPELQIRESRRILGEYSMQIEDVMTGKSFADSIAVGGYFVDIHSATDAHGTWIRTDKRYGIPYRTLLPAQLDNLLVTGRCISGTGQASASYRVMATCMALGQAAGTAASLCAAQGCLPRELDVELLRRTLIAQDAIVD